ncbi:MAG: Crp/Fnr family transcriptional regulator [Candidatus Acidiferrum sp.]
MEISIAVDARSARVKALHGMTDRRWPSKSKFETKHMEGQAFDVQTFLHSAGVARRVVNYGERETVFAQGDPAPSVLYLQKGGVKLTVVNEDGKEAVIAILGPGDFFGEGCLAEQPRRLNTASTIMPTTMLVIERPEMVRLLHEEQAFADRFIKHVLSRGIRAEENLIDQLLNSSEKRLARVLLLLGRHGEPGRPQERVPSPSQQRLAEMVGTTRPRVNMLMNKFRKLGFIEYGGLRGLEVNDSLRSVVLQG